MKWKAAAASKKKGKWKERYLCLLFMLELGGWQGLGGSMWEGNILKLFCLLVSLCLLCLWMKKTLLLPHIFWRGWRTLEVEVFIAPNCRPYYSKRWRVKSVRKVVPLSLSVRRIQMHIHANLNTERSGWGLSWSGSLPLSSAAESAETLLWLVCVMQREGKKITMKKKREVKEMRDRISAKMPRPFVMNEVQLWNEYAEDESTSGTSKGFECAQLPRNAPRKKVTGGGESDRFTLFEFPGAFVDRGLHISFASSPCGVLIFCFLRLLVIPWLIVFVLLCLRLPSCHVVFLSIHFTTSTHNHHLSQSIITLMRRWSWLTHHSYLHVCRFASSPLLLSLVGNSIVHHS